MIESDLSEESRSRPDQPLVYYDDEDTSRMLVNTTNVLIRRPLGDGARIMVYHT